MRSIVDRFSVKPLCSIRLLLLLLLSISYIHEVQNKYKHKRKAKRKAKKYRKVTRYGRVSDSSLWLEGHARKLCPGRTAGWFLCSYDSHVCCLSFVKWEYYTLSPVLWNVALLPRWSADGSQPFNTIWSGCLEHLCCDIAQAWCFSISFPSLQYRNKLRILLCCFLSSDVTWLWTCLIKSSKLKVTKSSYLISSKCNIGLVINGQPYELQRW